MRDKTSLLTQSLPILCSSEDANEEESFFEALQDSLNKILRKFPSEFDQDLFKYYLRFLALSEKEFRSHRSLRHQVRLICYHYLMRKKLLRAQRLMPNELDLEFRLLPTKLQFTFGQKNVLGIAIAIQLSSSYERFEDQHILRAVQKFLPHVQAVKESFFAFQKPRDLLRLLYLEVENSYNPTALLPEIQLLKGGLKEELKKHVQLLNPSTFGAFDVEETMRNIFTLSQELQHPSDLPQVMISFERALEKNFIFRLIVIRSATSASKSLQELFKTLGDEVEYIHERSSNIGSLHSETRIAKEASVFRLQIPKTPFFLRADLSFNVYRARGYVLSLLTQILGDVRDYNGGIFSKQIELFGQFKQAFGAIHEEAPELLEDFFHSLKPPEMQAILPLSSIKTLFELFLEASKEGLPLKESTILKTKQKENFLFVILRSRDLDLGDHLEEALRQNEYLQQMTCWLRFKNQGGLTLGYIYHPPTEKKGTLFLQLLEMHLEFWKDKLQSIQIARFSQQHIPLSLDPRLGGDLISGVILSMLFDGLMRIGKDGRPHPAIAQSVALSKDRKEYTFTLRDCTWNNGERITAHDFSYTWKKILSPSFNSAFSYLLYVIKNAKAAKEGLLPLDAIGVRAIDDTTLAVQLEQPCSYFLELVAYPLCAPVNHRLDRLYPNWPIQTGPSYICNGPFQLDHSHKQEGYELKKNPLYWDAKEVKLDRIQISRASGQKAKELFQNNEIDWLGYPFRPWEPFFSEETLGPIESISFTSIYWYVFNTQAFPFQSRDIRRAFSLGVDRNALRKTLSYQLEPTYTPLPILHSKFPRAVRPVQKERARLFFELGLKKMNLKREHFPALTISHPNNELRQKIAVAIAKEWQELFEIPVKTESYSFKQLFQKMTTGDYQIGAMNWQVRLNDPLYTLNAFLSASEKINFPKWESPKYQELIREINGTTSESSRNYLLAKAEALLTREVPIIPLFREEARLIRKDYIEGVIPSVIGNIDFKYAYINKEKKRFKNKKQ